MIQVAEGLARSLRGYMVLAIKSTVPVGTVELVRSILRQQLTEGEALDVVSNPEFLSQKWASVGHAWRRTCGQSFT